MHATATPPFFIAPPWLPHLALYAGVDLNTELIKGNSVIVWDCCLLVGPQLVPNYAKG